MQPPFIGGTDLATQNLFESSREVTLLEIASTELKAQVEVINATLGGQSNHGLSRLHVRRTQLFWLTSDDGGPAMKLHDFVHKSFVTPATCVVCDGSIWGKGRSCKKCNVAVHAKCELKVCQLSYSCPLRG